MLGKKTFYLALGYIAGNVISNMYTNKTKAPKTIQTKKDIQKHIDSLIETHKKAWKDITQSAIVEKHRQCTQDTLQTYTDTYLQEGKKMIEALRQSSYVRSSQEKTKSALETLRQHAQYIMTQVGEIEKKAKTSFQATSKDVSNSVDTSKTKKENLKK